MELTDNPRPALHRSLLVWTAITAGGALPPLILMWPRSARSEKAGMLIGIAVVILAVAAVDRRLRRSEPPWAAGILQDGAIGFVLLQGAGAAIFRDWFLFFLYAPAIVTMSKLLRLPDEISAATGHFSLTLVCALEAALVAYLIGWCLTVFRRRT